METIQPIPLEGLEKESKTLVNSKRHSVTIINDFKDERSDASFQKAYLPQINKHETIRSSAEL